MFKSTGYESKGKVTHLPRHLMAETLVRLDVDMDDIDVKGGWGQDVSQLVYKKVVKTEVLCKTAGI